MDAESKRQQVNLAQLTALLEFLKEHQELAKGLARGRRGKFHTLKIWNQCAKKLNNVKHGANKDGKGWSKYWCDWKYRVRRRALELRVAREHNRPIPDGTVPLSSMEESILDLIGENAVEGVVIRSDPLDDGNTEIDDEDTNNLKNDVTLTQHDTPRRSKRKRHREKSPKGSDLDYGGPSSPLEQKPRITPTKNGYKDDSGGGPPDPKMEDPISSRILSLIKTSAVGLYNLYDNDSVVPVQVDFETVTGSESEYLPVLCNTDLKKQNEVDQPLPVNEYGSTSVDIEFKDYTNVDEDVTMMVSETQKQEFINKNWGDYTPQLLKTPLSAQLKAPKTKSGISRRRPLHTPTTSSLELLHKKKIEAINYQKMLASEEAEAKKTLSNLEIEIKKESLKQEKIKTRLLLLELRTKRKNILGNPQDSLF